MVTVEIRGKQFPLCLTVAALDEMNARFGGLKNLTDFLNGSLLGEERDLASALYNRAWLLGLLIVEGEENRLIQARFSGGDTIRRAVPDGEALTHLLRPGQVNDYYGAVLQAINESLHQDIEAEPEKNVPHAGQA